MAVSAYSKRQRVKHANDLRKAADEAKSALKLEWRAWEGKQMKLEKRLHLLHTKVLRKREMWLNFRKELLKEKETTNERYCAVKGVCRKIMQE